LLRAHPVVSYQRAGGWIGRIGRWLRGQPVDLERRPVGDVVVCAVCDRSFIVSAAGIVQRRAVASSGVAAPASTSTAEELLRGGPQAESDMPWRGL
jgi:hypothetical protein